MNSRNNWKFAPATTRPAALSCLRTASSDRFTVPGSTAARAGLRDGDVLVRLGDSTLNSFDDLRAALRDARPGQTVQIVYLRDGMDHAVTATLEERL